MDLRVFLFVFRRHMKNVTDLVIFTAANFKDKSIL